MVAMRGAEEGWTGSLGLVDVNYYILDRKYEKDYIYITKSFHCTI